jgi:hypothetical protein
VIAWTLLAALAFAKPKPEAPPLPTPPIVVVRPGPAAPPRAPAPAPAPAPIPDVERLTAGIVVQVDDRDAAQRVVIADAEALGGWFSALGAQNVTVRVPNAKVPAMLERIRTLGEVVDRSFGREALGQQLADARSALAARQEVLARYYEVLGQAGPDSVVAVESEIDRVIREMESYQGRIRALEDRGTWAQVDVSFQFRDRSAPAPTGQSSFAWINRVDLALVLADFRGGRVSEKACVADVVIPDGFAAFKVKKHIAAVSPDDVVFRVRTLRNKPPADLPFWTEALRTRLVQAGYTLLSEGELPAANAKGHLLELVAPDGQKDARWMIGLFVDGRDIVVVEAAGEASKAMARREAILTAIGKSRL